jgi:hypothetical protein
MSIPRATVAGHEHAFWFVTVVSNPLRFNTRAALYAKFRKHILEDLGSNLLTVELMQCEMGPHVSAIHDPSTAVTQGGRSTSTWSVPSPAANPVTVMHPSESEVVVQVRSDSVLWHKENMLNVGFSFLPPSCIYVAWVDADLQFLNLDIVDNTVHQLQMYKVVQMFQNCVDMGPTGEVMQLHSSFGWCLRNRMTPPWALPAAAAADAASKKKGAKKSSEGSEGSTTYYYSQPEKKDEDDDRKKDKVQQVFFHPGYAYAARLDTLNQLGGLLDIAIVGSGDHHMAYCMVGKGDMSIPGYMHANYFSAIQKWQAMAERHVQRRLGYVNGTIVHGFHGFKHKRGYQSRWDILKDNVYDPLRDIKRNLHGVYEFTAPESQLAHDIIDYFKSRNEDIIAE